MRPGQDEVVVAAIAQADTALCQRTGKRAASPLT